MITKFKLFENYSYNFINAETHLTLNYYNNGLTTTNLEIYNNIDIILIYI